MLKHTPFFDFHLAAKAKMVDFAGWEMPLLYRSIVEEHNQTRNSGGLFDVSHMGRLTFTGKDAQALLDRVVTRKIADQQVGQSRYSLVCNETGGVLDDVIVSRDAKHWLVVCNASNRDKIVSHFAAVQKSTGMEVDMNDTTESTGMIAIQGPKVMDKLAEVLPVNPKNLKRYHFETASFMFFKVSIFRSGYTGEDGVEIILPAKMAAMAVKLLGGDNNPSATIQPAGLGARDTLRLEAAMPLYGHELSEEGDPLSAGLGWAVDLTKDFIGAASLRKLSADGLNKKLVGLELEGKRIARQGAPVMKDNLPVGTVTSGTSGPTVQKSIALAYVDITHAAEGNSLSVDLKGTAIAAKIVKLPFYKRSA